MNFQIHAHIQKLREQSLVQQDVDSNSLFPRDFLQVSEDVDVRENIHHHCNHLGCGAGRRVSGQPTRTAPYSWPSGLWTRSRNCQRIPPYPIPPSFSFCSISFPLTMDSYPFPKTLRPLYPTNLELTQLTLPTASQPLSSTLQISQNYKFNHYLDLL